MKILMATMGLDIGGAETHIVELCKALKRQGHDIAVVSNGGVYVAELAAAGVRHYNAPMHRRSLRTMAASRRILRDVIRKENPDIVHAHARIPAFLCGTLQKRERFPFVTTAHWVFTAKGILRYLTDWGQRTVAVSDDIKAYLIREYGVPAHHISVTINGIDTEKFSPNVSREPILEEFQLDGGQPVVSHVSRLDEDRALAARHLLAAAPRLAEAVPGVQILIAGGGNVFRELSEQAEDVNCRLGRRGVIMTGPRTDINRIVAAGDVFVGVSRAALEAMAAAKPVLVAGNEGYQGLFTADGLEEARLGNFCCRGMPPSTPERMLADLTDVLHKTPEERAALGAYGRQVIGEYYSVERMARDCLAMYDQVRRRKYNVVMSGYYGFSNAGDDAILQSIHQSIREVSDEVSVTVLSNNPEQTERLYGLESLPRFRVGAILKALRRCDALLSGGGSLLQDRTSTRSLLYYLSIIRAAHWLGKPVMLYANGIGPVYRNGDRQRVRKAVEQAALVTLRDESSAHELRDMGVTRTDLYVTADPVFRLAPEGEDRSWHLLEKAGLHRGTAFAAVSVRDWPHTEPFHRELAAVCDHIRRQYGLEILFLLMQPSRDAAPSSAVQGFMGEPSHMLEETCTPRELMGVLGCARLCLAMRLHTLIFAARMAVPVLGLVYDPKVESYLRELQLPSAGDVEHFDRREAIAQTDQLMADYEGTRQRLAKKSAALQKASRENERRLLEMLKQTKKP